MGMPASPGRLPGMPETNGAMPGHIMRTPPSMGAPLGPRSSGAAFSPHTDDAPAYCVIDLEPLLRGPWPCMDNDSDDSQYCHVASRVEG